MTADEQPDCLVVFRGKWDRFLFPGDQEIALRNAATTFAGENPFMADPDSLLAFPGCRAGDRVVYLICDRDMTATHQLRDAVRARQRDQWQADRAFLVRESEQENKPT